MSPYESTVLAAEQVRIDQWLAYHSLHDICSLEPSHSVGMRQHGLLRTNTHEHVVHLHG